VLDSVARTGRAIIVHESMANYGVGAEVAATIQEHSFLQLKAPVKRIAGWTTHTGLIYEKYIFPDVAREFSRLQYAMQCILTLYFRSLRCHPRIGSLLSGIVNGLCFVVVSNNDC
jgi:hypothetical protein